MFQQTWKNSETLFLTETSVLHLSLHTFEIWKWAGPVEIRVGNRICTLESLHIPGIFGSTHKVLNF